MRINPITVKVTCASGNAWITQMNATPEQARAYYYGFVYVTENEMTGQETKDPVVSCELLTD